MRGMTDQSFALDMVAIYRQTLDGRLLECNEACARMLGYSSRDELLAAGRMSYVNASDAFSIVAALPDLSNLSNATPDVSHATATILDDDKLELLVEESGPTVNQTAALDALLFLRDPFRVVGIPEWFADGPDRNTRVTFFVTGLQLNPGESPSAVIVQLGASNNQFFDVPAEDVRSVAHVEFTQVVIRLPDSLPAGTCTVIIRAHFRTSNIGTMRIAP